MVRRSPVPVESLAVFLALAIADDRQFERFDGVLQVFDKLRDRWVISH
jgi:hypothetical protein